MRSECLKTRVVMSGAAKDVVLCSIAWVVDTIVGRKRLWCEGSEWVVDVGDEVKGVVLR